MNRDPNYFLEKAKLFYSRARANDTARNSNSYVINGSSNSPTVSVVTTTIPATFRTSRTFRTPRTCTSCNSYTPGMTTNVSANVPVKIKPCTRYYDPVTRHYYNIDKIFEEVPPDPITNRTNTNLPISNNNNVSYDDPYDHISYDDMPYDDPLYDTSNNIPTNIPNNMPTTMPNNMPTTMPNNMPTTMPNNMPITIPNNIPCNTACNISCNIPYNLPYNLPYDIPDNSYFDPGVWYPQTQPNVRTTYDPATNQNYRVTKVYDPDGRYYYEHEEIDSGFVKAPGTNYYRPIYQPNLNAFC